MDQTPLHKTDLFKLLLQAYYDHLNNYRAFAKALDDLFRRVGLLSLEIRVGKASLGWVGRAPISLDGAVPTHRSGPPAGEK